MKSKWFRSYCHSLSKSSMMNSMFGATQIGWIGLMSFPMTWALGNFL